MLSPKFGLLSFNTVPMTMGTFIGEMGSRPILLIKVPIIINTMLKL